MYACIVALQFDFKFMSKLNDEILATKSKSLVAFYMYNLKGEPENERTRKSNGANRKRS